MLDGALNDGFLVDAPALPQLLRLQIFQGRLLVVGLFLLLRLAQLCCAVGLVLALCLRSCGLLLGGALARLLARARGRGSGLGPGRP